MGNNKTVWIIGANSGIGKSLALLLADNDWNVAISSHNEARLESISREYPNLNSFPLDVKDTNTLDFREALLN